MHVSQIIEVKEHLDRLKEQGLVLDWELPYENLLTRRSAALFYLTPTGESKLESIWEVLGQYDDFFQKPNEEKTLSKLEYRISFDGGTGEH